MMYRHEYYAAGGKSCFSMAVAGDNLAAQLYWCRLGIYWYVMGRLAEVFQTAK